MPRRIRRVQRQGRPGRFPSHPARSEEHTSELQSRSDLVCRLLLEKKKENTADGISQLLPSPQFPPYAKISRRVRVAPRVYLLVVNTAASLYGYLAHD